LRFILVRKRILGELKTVVEKSAWLDLGEIAQVEATSENPQHPIEAALLLTSVSGWRAESPGEQTIRLVFDHLLQIRCIRLIFEEHSIEREQEFTLSWSSGATEPLRTIVRQQYFFSPTGATQELEQYGVELDRVRALELRINPDRSGGSALASLEEFRIA
jgi:hypothetical protein